MDRDEILERLRADRESLDRFGVRTIAVFGSIARGEGRVSSDVDVLVDFREEATPGLFGFLDLKEHLEGLLGCAVDLATPKALHPALRDGILDEAVYA